MPITNSPYAHADGKVIVDDSLITSRQPDDLAAFCREIIKRLVQEEKLRLSNLFIQFSFPMEQY